MKTKTSRRNGLSIVEVFLVVATVILLTAFLLPSALRRRSNPNAPRIHCVSNLKQIGLASRLYANDHGDQFPWMVSTNFDPASTSGSREFTISPQVFRHFQVMSNELVTPKVLACSSDTKRTKANDFANFSNANLSYFVGFEAREDNPQSILSGDRNVTGGTLSNGFLRVFTGTSPAAGWTSEIHSNAGNIGLGDGSVQQVTTVGLQKQIAANTNAFLRLAIP